ncbi:14679_t:CDS:2, partial [Entrophospora sp. SA101]
MKQNGKKITRRTYTYNLSDDKTIDKPIKELLINNEKNKGLYENPIIKIGKDYKWTITHNKEHQHINIRALNKNSNSSSDYELSYEEEFIQCKLFDDRLTLITTNYIQIFAVDEKKNLIYVRYIRSHKLSIEGLKKSIKSIEKDYEEMIQYLTKDFYYLTKYGDMSLDGALNGGNEHFVEGMVESCLE